MSKVLEIWFKFDSDGDDEPSHAAEIRKSPSGPVVAWWHEDVGLVTERQFSAIDAAQDWLEESGYTPV